MRLIIIIALLCILAFQKCLAAEETNECGETRAEFIATPGICANPSSDLCNGGPANSFLDEEGKNVVQCMSGTTEMFNNMYELIGQE